MYTHTATRPIPYINAAHDRVLEHNNDTQHGLHSSIYRERRRGGREGVNTRGCMDHGLTYVLLGVAAHLVRVCAQVAHGGDEDAVGPVLAHLAHGVQRHDGQGQQRQHGKQSTLCRVRMAVMTVMRRLGMVYAVIKIGVQLFMHLRQRLCVGAWYVSLCVGGKNEPKTCGTGAYTPTTRV